MPTVVHSLDERAELSATLLSPREHESLHRRPVGLTLEVLDGPDAGQRVELPHQGTMTGGRAPTHHVVLTHDSVSTTHFEIRLQPHGALLRDLGSTNGTWLGRSRLTNGVVRLYDGAVFYVGDVKLRLVQLDVGSVACSNRPTIGTMTGTSPVMREIFALIDRLAPTPITTLITGETGTGKEEVARTLHTLSGRRGPFVVLDCSTLPSNLAESAILGHVKGAFTGATHDRKGAFEAAHGGTVLLDEIGELPLALQPKLLRVLDRSEVDPVGSTKTRSIDVRVLAATHRDLPTLVAEGRFRVDLLHRLRQFEISLPPLRERPQDIESLSHHFLRRARDHYGESVATTITPEALQMLTGRYWEGNVRELRQTIETLAHLAHHETIGVEDLNRFAGRGQLHHPNSSVNMARWCSMPCKEATDEFTRHYLARLFEQSDGNIESLCERAGYTRKGMRGLYERLGLTWPPAHDQARGIRVEPGTSESSGSRRV